MFSNFFNNFLENIDPNYKDKLYELSKIDNGYGYMKLCLGTNYWRPHMQVLDNIELHKFHKDSKILDTAIWASILLNIAQFIVFLNQNSSVLFN